MSDFEYHINEFAVHSDSRLPYDACARAASPIPAANHITLRRASLADIPCTLRKLRRQMVYDVGDGFLVEPPGLALHIDLKAAVLTLDCPDDKLTVAAAWAVHAGLGAATLTRGGVPLHGAGLEIGGKYAALMADSGTGKSTLSWFLMTRGALFGNDDLIPTYLSEAGVTAYPSVSLSPKLSREAVDRHGLNPAVLPPANYGTGEEEYYVPLPPEKRVTAPAPLSAVFLLHPFLPAPDAPEHGGVTVERLPEDAAAATLRANLHAVWLLGKWMDGRKLDTLCRRLAAHVPVYTLAYSRAYALLPAVSAAIHTTLEML